MIRIERMTAGALRRGGLSGGRLSLLVLDTVHRRGASRRALERAARSRLGVRHPAYDDPSPLEYPPPAAGGRAEGVLVGEVRLGRDMRWEDGTVRGHLPSIFRTAIMGRRLGDVLDHPDVDPEATILPPARSDALFSVRREEIPLVRPTLRERLTHPHYRFRLWLEECMTDSPCTPRQRMACLLLAAGSLPLAALVTALHARGDVGIVPTMCLWLSACWLTAGAVGTHRPRRFSILHGTNAVADIRHEETMMRLEKEPNA